jgi:flagellar biosynthesis/type III secretory pathway M-ring protein FliF/YscJ
VIQNFWGNAIYSLVPTILLGIVFWVVMRAIIRSDRTERKVYSDIEAEERARFDAEQLSASPNK